MNFEERQREYAEEAGQRTRIAILCAIKAGPSKVEGMDVFELLVVSNARAAHHYWAQLETYRSLREEIGLCECRTAGCGHPAFDHGVRGFCAHCQRECWS